MTWEFQIARIEYTLTGETITAIDIGETVFDFFPASPPLNIIRTAGPVEGSVPVVHEAQNVTETARIRLPSASWASAFRALETALQRALQWAEEERRDVRTVLRFRDTNRHANYYEAPLYDGRIELERGPLARITWERGPYWMGPVERLALTNDRSDAMGITEDYAAITNCDDANPDHSNWVAVTPPAGDVPTPARIRIQNDYDVQERLREVRIGWYDRKQNLILEGEDSETDVTIVPDTAASQQVYAVGDAFTWEIPQSIYRDFVGPFRVLANGDLPADSTWRISAGYEMTRLQYGTRVAVNGAGTGWTDLGWLSMPPGGYLSPTRAPLTIWLDGSEEAKLDFVQLLPARQHRRMAFQHGYNCVHGACIVDDGIDDAVYYDFDGTKYPLIDAWGDPLLIWPSGMLPYSAPASAHDQVLVFAMENDGGRAEPLRTALVEIHVRPRYRTLP